MNNRPIKFRVWDTKYNRWLENGSSLHCYSNWQIDPFTGEVTDFVGSIAGSGEQFVKSDPSDNYIVQQFTGLLDSAGKEIYEGDIIVDSTGVSTVYFQNGCFWVDDMWLYDYNRTSKVIGNIFENSNLLK